jgi:hypothetical protein
VKEAKLYVHGASRPDRLAAASWILVADDGPSDSDSRLISGETANAALVGATALGMNAAKERESSPSPSCRRRRC